jgi:hypothetical protein
VSGASGRIIEVAELDLAFEPRPWRFAEERADEIEANWVERKAKLPLLFNGRVLLLGRYEFSTRADGRTVLRGAYFDADYKSFLAWRDFGFPDAGACNGFSMAALQSLDGAFLLGEMAAHTANAGSVYFAAGTPDMNDVFGARVDLAASVWRELHEETGLSPADGVAEPGWIIVHAPPRIACMKIFRLNERAEAIKERVDAFLAADPHAELRRLHTIRELGDLDGLNSPRFIADFLTHALSESYSSVG